MLIEDTNSVANSIDKITKEYELVMTQLKQPLTNIQRTKVISLLADKHYNLQISNHCMKNKINDEYDFSWKMFVR